MREKDGKESHFCPECHVLMHLALMIQNNVFERSLLDSAFSANQTGRFSESLPAFEILTEKIENLIVEYCNKMTRTENREEKKSTRALITDFLDACSYIRLKGGLCAIGASQSAPSRHEPAVDIVAVEHLTKAIQNRMPYKYLTSQNKIMPGTPKNKIKLLEIPRPYDILETCGTQPVIDFEKLKLEISFGEADEAILVANETRLNNDLAFLAECYTGLGKALLHFRTCPQQAFWGRSETEATRRGTLANKLIPPAFAYAIKAYNMARDCIEKLPTTEETLRMRTAYGTTLFDEAMCWYMQKQPDMAEELFKRALNIYRNREKWPPPQNAELAIADCCLYLGECEAELNKLETAKEHLKESLKISTKLNTKDNITKANQLLHKLDEEHPQYTK